MHAVSPVHMCFGNRLCCHNEIEFEEQTSHLILPQYTGTESTSPSADPVTPGGGRGSHNSTAWNSPLWFGRGQWASSAAAAAAAFPSYISWLHRSSSSSAFPAISLGFTILLLLRSQLYLLASPFFFFCVPSYISGLHHSSSSAIPAISLGFTVLLLLLRSQLDLWASPFFFFCVPSYTTGVHRSSSSSFAFPARSLGITVLLLLLLRSLLDLWASPFFFFFFCVPS